MNMKNMLAEQKEAMLVHKYIESEKAGHDMGERSMVDWTKEFGRKWRIGYNQRHMMDLGDGTAPEYFAIFLNQDSKEFLLNMMRDVIPDGWKVYCRHCLLSYGDPSDSRPVFDFLAEHLGQNVDMEITALGISEQAIAVRVAGNFSTKNEIPHITIAVPCDGKADNSKSIQEWEPITVGRKLVGVVDANPSHFGWQH